MKVESKSKKLAIRVSLALTSILMVLLVLIFGPVVRSYYRDSKMGPVFAPCAAAIKLDPDRAGLPCYQKALSYDPDNQYMLFRTATVLIDLGRFDEARPLLQRAAGEIGLQTNDARQLLRPGAMQSWKSSIDRLTQANMEYRTLVQRHGREAIAFQAAHDTSVEPYKTQMREMVKAHVRQEREMMIAKGVWKPSVLQEPYYLIRKH